MPADVGSLTIALSRVVGDREKDLEDLAVGYPARVIDDLDGLGVVRRSTRDRLIIGGLG